MMGTTHCFFTDEKDNTTQPKMVCAFSLSNSSLRTDILPQNRRNRLNRSIPNAKRRFQYPAILIGELCVFDGFGHKMLTGCGKYLENYVKAEFGIKCRSIELNLPQRCSSLLASATDIDEAEKAGKAAVVAALDGETGKMITFVRDDTNGYEINYGLADVNDICNKEKKFPAEWITAEGTDISDEYIKYVRPLIQGTNIAEYSDGVPVHLKPAYYR